MKLPIILFFLTSLASFAQNNTSILYHRQMCVHSIAKKPKKAYYISETTVLPNGNKTFVMKSMDDGKLIQKGTYGADGKPIGWWRCTNHRGIDQKIYYSDSLKEHPYLHEVNKDKVDSTNFLPASFEFKEENISYFGALETLRYPMSAKMCEQQGTVKIILFVSKTGETKRVSILQSAGVYLDAQVYEMFETVNNWKPAMKDGNPIDSYIVVPLKFELL